MKKIITLIAMAIFCSATIASAQNVTVVMGQTKNYLTQNSSGVVTSVLYEIPISITANGSTPYIGQTINLANVASGTHAFAFVFQKSNQAIVDDVVSGASISLNSSDATIEVNGYRLDDGQTKHFTLLINLTNPSTSHTAFRVQINQLRLFTEASLINGVNVDLQPSENFRTDFVFIDGSNTSIASLSPKGIRLFSQKDAIVEIFTITGQKVMVIRLKGNEEILPDLPSGMYLMTFLIEGKLTAEKIGH